MDKNVLIILCVYLTQADQSIDPEYFNIKVRYGSNVRILDSDSQEYQNEYLDTGEQYY